MSMALEFLAHEFSSAHLTTSSAEKHQLLPTSTTTISLAFPCIKEKMPSFEETKNAPAAGQEEAMKQQAAEAKKSSKSHTFSRAS